MSADDSYKLQQRMVVGLIILLRGSEEGGGWGEYGLICMYKKAAIILYNSFLAKFLSLYLTNKMSHSVLPAAFISRSDPFRSLPAEMVSNIFGYLDDDTLVSIFLTCERFKWICLHDPELRRKLETRNTSILREKRNRRLNPKLYVQVIRNRDTPSRTFTENLQKTVKIIIPTATRKNNCFLTIPTLTKSDPDAKNKTTYHRPMRI